MAKLSEKYEAIIVLNTKAGEEGIKALVEKINGIIAKNATVDSVDEWGKRRLAYPIEDETEGYYIFTTVDCEPSLPAELERIAGITEGVLRIMVIKK